MRRISTSLFFLLAISGAGLSSQSLSLSVESGLGWWLRSDGLLPLSSTFEGKVEGKVGEPELPSAHYSAMIRADYDPLTAATKVSLKEAWIKSYAGPFDLSIGTQRVAWGSTDVFTPVDVVNPKDFSLPIAAEKKPIPLGRAVFNGKGFSMDIVVVPFWTGSDLPAARWQGSSASPPPGIVIDNQALITESPRASWDNLQFGGRLQATLDWFQGFDIGLTYFRGRDTIPTASVAMAPTATPGHYDMLVTMDYDRYSLGGIDAVLALDEGVLLRAEGGYKARNDSSWLSPDAGSASAEAVAGCEYAMARVSFMGELALDWAKGPAGSGDSLAKTIVAMVSAEPGARWSLKGLVIFNLDGSGAASPQASFALADGLAAEVKAFAFWGGRSTKYGAWDDNDLAEMGFKYSY
jgi:hypothetical protein